MLKIIFSIKDAKDLGETLGLPAEKVLRMWAVAILNLAKSHAAERGREEGGRSFWQKQILPSVRKTVSGEKADVFSDSYIAEHVHTGGIIRPRNAKYLAIPIAAEARGKFAKDMPGLIFVRSKDENKLFLARQMKRKIKPLFVLKRSVMQKARPWWPTPAETDAESDRFFSEDI